MCDLRERLAKTKWPDEIPGSDWNYGTNLDFMKSIAKYWQEEYDWRKIEERLNAIPQFMVNIDGYKIHYLYIKGESDKALPLILTSGWPSSFIEFERVIGPLSRPSAFGSSSSESFDVVIPAIPGYGFSGSVPQKGYIRVDNLWRKLMTEILGYKTFVAHGTDVGAGITSDLGRFHGDIVEMIHIGSVDLDWPEAMPAEDELSVEEKDYIGRVKRWGKEQGAYREIQATYPQTIAYALNDSPIGLASWIIEKYYRWSDCGGNIESRFSKEHLITNVMIYWLTDTINSSMRRYYDERRERTLTTRIETPTAISMFPGEKELLVPRSWAERTYNIVRWTDPPKGGHFPAFEEPMLFVKDIREAFRDCRK